MEIQKKRIRLGLSESRVAAVVLMMSSVACGPMEGAPAPAGEDSTSHVQELESDNGLTVNGLTVNGLTVNGLTVNGLTVNGLASSSFSAWFAGDVVLNSQIMKYLVQCAVPAGESRSYQAPSSGASYTWPGLLGLAPGWASGQRFTEAEQQLVSACLAAHVNKFGLNVPLSVLGRNAQLQPIPYSASELQRHPRREACFFGNLFTREGLFAGVDRNYLRREESSSRACGLSTYQASFVSECRPIIHLPSCELFCTLDTSGLFYTRCMLGGRTYLPLTTRIRAEDVYSCGDGVCQSTEQCGTGSQATSCLSDCGPCP
jgi:hypothetical protein